MKWVNRKTLTVIIGLIVAIIIILTSSSMDAGISEGGINQPEIIYKGLQADAIRPPAFLTKLLFR